MVILTILILFMVSLIMVFSHNYFKLFVGLGIIGLIIINFAIIILLVVGLIIIGFATINFAILIYICALRCKRMDLRPLE